MEPSTAFHNSRTITGVLRAFQAVRFQLDRQGAASRHEHPGAPRGRGRRQGRRHGLTGPGDPRIANFRRGSVLGRVSGEPQGLVCPRSLTSSADSRVTDAQHDGIRLGQTSALGPLSGAFLSTFFAACCGFDPLEFLAQESAEATSIKARFSVDDVKVRRLLPFTPPWMCIR